MSSSAYQSSTTLFSKCDTQTSDICSMACGLIGAAHCQGHCRPSESAPWGQGLVACAVTCSPIVTAHSRLAATGALEFGVTSFSLYHIFLLLDCHLYDKLTNLEGEDEFGTNIFNTVDDRRSVLIRGDFIKIYIGGSVGWHWLNQLFLFCCCSWSIIFTLLMYLLPWTIIKMVHFSFPKHQMIILLFKLSLWIWESVLLLS